MELAAWHPNKDDLAKTWAIDAPSVRAKRRRRRAHKIRGDESGKSLDFGNRVRNMELILSNIPLLRGLVVDNG